MTEFICVFGKHMQSLLSARIAESNRAFFFFVCLFSFFLLAQGSISFWDWYCYAFFSPYLSGLHHPLPCPVSFPVSHALLLLSLILCLLQYLLVSVFSSFPSLLHRGTNIISEGCETANAPWHSWKPHDFGVVRILAKLKALCKWAPLAKTHPKGSCRNKKGMREA